MGFGFYVCLQNVATYANQSEKTYFFNQLGRKTNSTASCVFPRFLPLALQQLHVFPRFTPDPCFPAFAPVLSFHALHRLHAFFPRFPPFRFIAFQWLAENLDGAYSKVKHRDIFHC